MRASGIQDQIDKMNMNAPWHFGFLYPGSIHPSEWHMSADISGWLSISAYRISTCKPNGSCWTRRTRLVSYGMGWSGGKLYVTCSGVTGNKSLARCFSCTVYCMINNTRPYPMHLAMLTIHTVIHAVRSWVTHFIIVKVSLGYWKGAPQLLDRIALSDCRHIGIK